MLYHWRPGRLMRRWKWRRLKSYGYRIFLSSDPLVFATLEAWHRSVGAKRS